MDIRQATAWILLLVLFPMSFFWLRRAWRILMRRDHSEVALKRGEAPAPPIAAKFAPFTAVINLAAGATATAVIVLVLTGVLAYESWTAIAGSTIWLKLVADFIIARHAHPIRLRKQ